MLLFVMLLGLCMLIGSSINIGNRLVDHLVTKNTNEHLQNAIAKYGLENFTFAVVEFSLVILKYYYSVFRTPLGSRVRS